MTAYCSSWTKEGSSTAKARWFNAARSSLIATTNAGAELYRSQRFGFSEGRRAWDIAKAIQSELERLFRFEFLNRFDRIVHFHPLRRKHIRVIAQRELGLLRERSGIKQRKLSLDVDESVLDWLSVRGYDPDYGARFLKRLIERDVTSTLAEAIVRESAEPGSRIELRIRGNQVTARVHARKPASGSVEPLPAEARTKPATATAGTGSDRGSDLESPRRRQTASILARRQARRALEPHRADERAGILGQS